MNFSDIFKALSDETRLRIVNLILTSGKSLCVCEIVYALKLPQYLVSRHLGILKNSGLIKGRKEGKWIYYSLNKKDLNFKKELFKLLEKYLKNRVYKKDIERLKKRLLLRKNDKCVIGF